METIEMRSTIPIASGQEHRTGMPSWDAVMADVARIIREDSLYPEEMPLECFDII